MLRLYHAPDLAMQGEGLRRDSGSRTGSGQHGPALLFDESDPPDGRLESSDRNTYEQQSELPLLAALIELVVAVVETGHLGRAHAKDLG